MFLMLFSCKGQLAPTRLEICRKPHLLEYFLAQNSLFCILVLSFQLCVSLQFIHENVVKLENWDIVITLYNLIRQLLIKKGE